MSIEFRAGRHVAWLPVLLLLGACQPSGTPSSGAPAATELTPHVVTHYAPGSELFVEFAPLISGQPSSFAAHFTRLSDFQPVTEGQVEVILSGAGGPTERFRVRAPARAGLFKPTVVPQASGDRQLSLVLESPGLSVRHDLGALRVHADVAAAAAAPPPAAPAGDIGYLKEQQWQTAFATEAVAETTLRDSISATATVRAASDREFLLTAPTAGRVLAGDAGFPVLGQAFETGQVLARLVPQLGIGTDSSTLASDASEARIAAGLATAERERLERLLREEAVSGRRVEQARAAERIAQLRFSAATARQSGQAGGDVGGIALRARISGVLAAVPITAGAAVPEGATLFHIVDRSQLWLEASVAERDAARLASPGGIEFELPGVAAPIRIMVGENGQLVGVGSVIDPASRTLPVIFAMDDPPANLRLNQRVDARVFTGATRQGLSVPATAILEDAGQRVVYVQRSGELFARVAVEPGLRDGERVEVTQGLKAGDRVVTTGALQIRLAAATPEAMGHGHAH